MSKDGEQSHAEKLRLAGIKRHGSEEAWRNWMRGNQAKAQETIKRNNIKLGFATIDPETHRQLSSKGGKSKRRNQ